MNTPQRLFRAIGTDDASVQFLAPQIAAKGNGELKYVERLDRVQEHSTCKRAVS